MIATRSAPCAAFAAVARSERRVDDLVVLAAFTDRAGAGVMRHLMSRGVHHGRIVPKNVLGAVAVVDVEIHDRDALGAMRFLRVPGGDGGVVEEAEAHRVCDFGVMSGRAGRDKSVANLAAHHLVDREDRASSRAKRGLERARRHGSVRVDRGQALLRRRRADRFDVILRMDARDCREVGARRGIARQHLKRLALERALDRAQAVRPLGMTLAHVMREAGGVRDDERGPVFGVLRGDFRSLPSVRRTFAPAPAKVHSPKRPRLAYASDLT